MSTDTTQPKSLDELLVPPAATSAPSAPTRILETIALRFLARVVHADGTVDPREVSRLVEIAKALEMTGDEARRILDDEFGRKSDCAQLATQVPARTARREIYAMGCLIAIADGSVGDTERAVLADFARGAEIPETDATGILDAVVEAATHR